MKSLDEALLADFRKLQFDDLRDPSMPAAALRRFAQDGDELWRMAVALNPSTPAEVLTQLAEDPKASVRNSVAWNASAPSAALLSLSRRVRLAWDARYKIAESPRAPAEALRPLADDADAEVRSCVASNRFTPRRVLAQLDKDPNVGVRQAAAKCLKKGARDA